MGGNPLRATRMSTESIRTSCPNCSVSIRVPATAAGRRARCPKCKGVLVIPALEPATVSEAPTDSGFDDDVLSGLGQGSAVAVAPEVAQQRQAALSAAQARVTPVAATAKTIAKSGPKFD